MRWSQFRVNKRFLCPFCTARPALWGTANTMCSTVIFISENQFNRQFHESLTRQAKPKVETHVKLKEINSKLQTYIDHRCWKFKCMTVLSTRNFIRSSNNNHITMSTGYLLFHKKWVWPAAYLKMLLLIFYKRIDWLWHNFLWYS